MCEEREAATGLCRRDADADMVRGWEGKEDDGCGRKQWITAGKRRRRVEDKDITGRRFDTVKGVHVQYDQK